MSIQVTSSTPPSSTPATIQHSPWHSPVPYLFGGLAALLTLIAFALFILAYSYWKLSSDVERHNGVNIDLESQNHNRDSNLANYTVQPVFEEKYFVIMAGHVKPTFLATPISSSDRHNSTVKCELDMLEDHLSY